MAELIRDPFTGQYTFANPTTAVINQQTGQTAASAQAISNTGTALGATTPVQQANVATYFTPQATLKDTSVAPQINQAYSGSYTPPPPPTPPPTPAVSSSTLNPPPTTNFQQPAQTSSAPAAAAAYSTTAPDFSLSSSQQGAQDLNSQLQALNNQLVGKSAYQTEQESKYGVPGFQSTLTDLGSQLTALKNEAAAIPLQLQQGAAERGVTTPVLGRQENSRLRTNAIAALGVSSLMAAAQGQLANAQSLADKAVQQKYGPIEEQIEAGMKNLNLIMNSPQYTQDEKKQAFQQQQYLQQQAQAIADQKQAYQQVLSIGTSAASNIQNFTPNGQYQTAAQALQAITQAQTPQQALQIAASVGLTGSGPAQAQILSIQEAQALGVPYGTTQAQAAQMGIIPQGGTSGGGFSLSPGQTRYDAQGNILATAPGKTGTPPLKLSAATQDKLTSLQTITNLADTVLASGEATGWDGVGGLYSGSISQFLAKNFGMGTPEAEQLRNNISNITATLAKARAGTSFTEGEKALLQQYTPTINDSPLVIQSKLASLKSYAETETQNTYSVAQGTQNTIQTSVEDYLDSLGL